MPVYPYNPQVRGPYLQCIGPMYQPFKRLAVVVFSG